MTHDIRYATFLKISGRYRRRYGCSKQCATEKGKEDVLNMNKNVKSSIHGAELKQENGSPPNFYAIHAKWVTITLKDIQIIPQYLQWKATRKKMRTVYMVQSWNSTIYVVQSWNKEDKKIRWWRMNSVLFYLTKKTWSQTTKDEFYAFYLKKKNGSPTTRWINWLLSRWREEMPI